MNQAHLHLLLNHFPVIGTILCLLLLLVALVRKSDELKRIGLGALVFIALLTIPAYLTGEPAAKIVEQLPGVAEINIKAHEEAALVAFIALLVTGAIAVAGLIRFRRPKLIPSWAMAVMLALTGLNVGLMARTANLGGQIRHTEINTSAAPPGGESASPSRNPHQPEEEKEHK